MSTLYNVLKIPYHLVKRISRNFNLVFQRLFFKLDKNYLRKKFLQLGLKEGMDVYVHSSLSKFGYIEDGANSILTVLQDIIQDGTIMMPTFTYPKKEFTLQDPCWTGKLPELFRLQENVKRSVHVTHSVAVKGKLPNSLVKDHIKSKRPFDNNSPFAKFAKLDSYVLMLGTENNSMVHYIQDKVNFPNLFLLGLHEFKFGNKIIKTRLHHPKGSITYICNGKPCTDVEFLVKMYVNENFHEHGVMRTIKIGKATCHLIKTKEFVEIATKYLKDNIKRYKNEYNLILENESN
ncbi:MAG: AAC(3) family N-acetyltransferase [Nanoarchaeota archaeon]